ncbi:MAG: AAA family ATPase [Promethearchaeota archaeon]
MAIAIIPSFMDAFSKLTSSEKSQTKKSLTRFLNNTEDVKGLRLHKIGDFFSISPNMDLRVLLIPWKNGFAAVYVDHHDNAYSWAERHRAIRDEKQGIFELIDIQIKSERGRVAQEGPYSFKSLSGYIPQELIDLLESSVNEDSLIQLLNWLSPELQELVLELTTNPNCPVFNKPRSTIQLLQSDDELENALKYHLDKWRIFLHSRQVEIVNSSSGNNIVVVGGPGTGKTVALAHRAKHLLDSNHFRTIVVVTPTLRLEQHIQAMLSKLGASKDKIIFQCPKSAKAPFMLNIDNIGVSHVLVDEFQRYLNDDWIKLKRFLQERASSWTVFIDSYQRGGVLPMEFLSSQIGSKMSTFNLDYAYRNTKEIIDFATMLSKCLHKKIDQKVQKKSVGHVVRRRKSSRETPHCDLSAKIKNIFSPQKLIAVVSGPKIEFISARPYDVPHVLKTQLLKIGKYYDLSECAIIVNLPFENVRNRNKLETKIGINAIKRYMNELKLPINIHSHNDCIGLEYKAGVVIGINRYKIDRRFELSYMATYLAITRFREFLVGIEITGIPKG